MTSSQAAPRLPHGQNRNVGRGALRGAHSRHVETSVLLVTKGPCFSYKTPSVLCEWDVSSPYVMQHSLCQLEHSASSHEWGPPHTCRSPVGSDASVCKAWTCSTASPMLWPFETLAQPEGQLEFAHMTRMEPPVKMTSAPLLL